MFRFLEPQRACPVAWLTGSAVASRKSEVNMGPGERIVSALAGTALAGSGIYRLLRHGSPWGVVCAALGAGLTFRAATGHCPVYAALGVRRVDAEPLSNPLTRDIHVQHSVTIQRSPDELYRFWRELSNLPMAMKYLDRVEVLDERRSRWTLCGPAGSRLSFEAEITEDVPGELIAWRSASGAPVGTFGNVRFRPAAGGRGTLVKLHVVFQPVGGAIAAGLAALLGRDPGRTTKQHLREFKAFLEAGEVLRNTSTSGRTGAAAALAKHAAPALGPRAARRIDAVAEASAESFPASDAPAWTPVQGA